jgi:hypothetical protein
MATLSVTHPNLLDLAKRQDPDGKIANIVELLAQTNQILADMVWVEGNLIDGHRTTVRTGLPEPTWRKIYGGVQPTKSRTAQITDRTGMMEAYAEIDKALAELNGNRPEWRMSEEKAHMEGMNQDMAQKVFYGNEGTLPEAFTGLAPRFNLSSAPNGDNIIKGGSSDTDNRSIWLIGWSEATCHGIIPKGSIAGLQHRDLGEVTIENIDGSGGRMQAYRSHFRWDAGLCVRDWRYVVRICNIDFSALTADASSGANLPNLMFQAMDCLPEMESVRPAFYMDRHVRRFVRQQVPSAVKASTLKMENVGGVLIETFQGIPMRRCDALAADEALVS